MSGYTNDHCSKNVRRNNLAILPLQCSIIVKSSLMVPKCHRIRGICIHPSWENCLRTESIQTWIYCGGGHPINRQARTGGKYGLSCSMVVFAASAAVRARKSKATSTWPTSLFRNLTDKSTLSVSHPNLNKKHVRPTRPSPSAAQLH